MDTSELNDNPAQLRFLVQHYKDICKQQAARIIDLEAQVALYRQDPGRATKVENSNGQTQSVAGDSGAAQPALSTLSRASVDEHKGTAETGLTTPPLSIAGTPVALGTRAETRSTRGPFPGHDESSDNDNLAEVARRIRSERTRSQNRGPMRRKREPSPEINASLNPDLDVESESCSRSDPDSPLAASMSRSNGVQKVKRRRMLLEVVVPRLTPDMRRVYASPSPLAADAKDKKRDIPDDCSDEDSGDEGDDDMYEEEFDEEWGAFSLSPLTPLPSRSPTPMQVDSEIAEAEPIASELPLPQEKPLSVPEMHLPERQVIFSHSSTTEPISQVLEVPRPSPQETQRAVYHFRSPSRELSYFDPVPEQRVPTPPPMGPEPPSADDSDTGQPGLQIIQHSLRSPQSQKLLLSPLRAGPTSTPIDSAEQTSNAPLNRDIDEEHSLVHPRVTHSSPPSSSSLLSGSQTQPLSSTVSTSQAPPSSTHPHNLSSTITQPQAGPPTQSIQAKDRRQRSKHRLVVAGVEVKRAPFLMDEQATRNRLDGCAHYNVTVDAALGSILVDRDFISSSYGGASQRLCAISRDGRSFIFPTLAMDPQLPLDLGMPGLLCRANVERDWKDGPQKLFVGLRPSKFRYMGDYELSLSTALSEQEYRAWPTSMKEKWADAILRKLKHRDIRVRIVMRRELGREPTVVELADAITDRGLRDYKNVSREEVINAYEQGLETMFVFRMQCVHYDVDFIGDIAQKLPHYVRKSRAPRKEKAQPNAAPSPSAPPLS